MMRKYLWGVVGFIWIWISLGTWAKYPSIKAEGAILIESKTNTILYEKNAHQRLYPASTTKILTALLIEQSLDEKQVITKSQDSVNTVPRDSSHIGLQVGESYTVQEGLYGLMVGSDNFIAHDLAKAAKGSIEAFANWMNEEAKACGALNTHFTNPHGYHDSNHYTTAYDLGKIAQKAFANEKVVKLAGTSDYTFHVKNNNRTLEIYNKNKILREGTPYYNKNVVAAKTGYHSDAKQALVAKAVYGEMELIAVVMKTDSPDQYQDMNKLFKYGAENFKVRGTKGSYQLTNRTASPWAQDMVSMGMERNWMVDKGQNYQQPIAVSELIYMLNAALNPTNRMTLSQVATLTGQTDLKEGNQLKRVQAAALVRGMCEQEGWLQPIQIINPYIPDIERVSAYEKSNIEFMVKRQLLGNKDVDFRPYEYLTWQEAIVMTSRVLK
ncbi:MAG: D-alanyl-D-alanine carboxypeptidase [Niameybacter sp.]